MADGRRLLDQHVRQDFWDVFLARVRDVHPEWTRTKTLKSSTIDLRSPNPRDYSFPVSIWDDRISTRIYFKSDDADLNAASFEAVRRHRVELETAIDARLALDRKKGFKVYTAGVERLVDLRDRANWEAAIDWAIDKHDALRTELQSIVGIDTTIR